MEIRNGNETICCLGMVRCMDVHPPFLLICSVSILIDKLNLCGRLRSHNKLHFLVITWE
jgi:hypothetical protein